MGADVVAEVFWDQVKRSGPRVALRTRRSGQSDDVTWTGYGELVRQAGNGLLALGLEPGQAVALMGSNRREWLVADLGIICAGGRCVPIYTTLTLAQIGYILEHSEARAAIVETEEMADRVRRAPMPLPELRAIVVMAPGGAADRASAAADGQPRVISFQALLEAGAAFARAAPQALDRRMEQGRPEDVVTIVYTSGTTGPPKGAMLTNHNLTWTARSLLQVTPAPTEGEVTLSFLPLSHIAERMVSVCLAITSGNTVCFGAGLETLLDDLKAVRPTLFFAVPRLWEKFYAGISAQFVGAHGLKRTLIEWAQRVGREAARRTAAGAPLSVGQRLQLRLADRLVYRKVRKGVGLDRARTLVSGAAPLSPDILWFLHSVGLPVREVYGQTEGSGPTSIHHPGRVRIGNVGQAIPGVDLRIADDGEILVKGGNVFAGYFKDPDRTAATLRDGWLYSGDVGTLDADGFLKITDRKKDIIITAGGKNIAPANIENLLKARPMVSQVIAVGDRRPYVTALVTLDPSALAAWAREQGIVANGHGERVRHPQAVGLVSRYVDELNAELARFEQIKRFTILDHDLSIEGGQLTPTLKVKRNVCIQLYQPEIEAMYAPAEPAPAAG